MGNVIVHSFLSDGLCGFGNVFLRSFKEHHGNSTPIILTSVGLDATQEKTLSAAYSNLEVRNKPLNLEAYAAALEVDVQTISRWKREVESEVTSDENFHWKIMMSVEERYRSLPALADECRRAGYDYLLHSDIDVYFRQPLDRLWQIAENFDICGYKRPWMTENGLILGAFLMFKLNGPSDTFFSRWQHHLNVLSPKEKPRGYGQISLTRAYQDTKQICRWGDLMTEEGAPTISKTREARAGIWLGNSNQGRNRKNLSAKIFQEDLDSFKKLGASIDSSEYRARKFPNYCQHNPSRAYQQVLRAMEHSSDLGQSPANDPLLANSTTIVRELLQTHAATELTDYGSFDPLRYSREKVFLDQETQRQHRGFADLWGADQIDLYKPEIQQRKAQNSSQGVISSGFLEQMPLSDITWIIEDMFCIAERFVFCAIGCQHSQSKQLQSSGGLKYMEPLWWAGLFRGISARHEGVDYSIYFEVTDATGMRRQGHFRRQVPP